jgi:hypothetical protein
MPLWITQISFCPAHPRGEPTRDEDNNAGSLQNFKMTGRRPTDLPTVVREPTHAEEIGRLQQQN